MTIVDHDAAIEKLEAEIERLREERDEAKFALDEEQMHRSACEKENEQLREDADQWAVACKSYEAEIGRLREEQDERESNRARNLDKLHAEIAVLEARLAESVELGELEIVECNWTRVHGSTWIALYKGEEIKELGSPQAAVDALIAKLKEERDD